MRARRRIIDRFQAGFIVAWAAMAVGYAATDESKTGGIQSAKRDYETLQAAAANAKSPPSASPKQALPVLDATPHSADEPAPIRPALRNALTEKQARSRKSTNWLLDAMREKKAGTAAERDKLGIGTRREDELPESDGEDLLANAAELERDAIAAEEEKRRSDEERQRAPQPVNPLDRYMASWMTPKDFELLQKYPDRSSPDTPRLSGTMLPSDTTDHGGNFPSLGAETAMREIAARDLLSYSPSQPNPYLVETPRALSAPLIGAPANMPPAGSALTAPASPPLVQQPATEPSPPRVPLSETLRGADDAKYFKQLKRF